LNESDNGADVDIGCVEGRLLLCTIGSVDDIIVGFGEGIPLDAGIGFIVGAKAESAVDGVIVSCCVLAVEFDSSDFDGLNECVKIGSLLLELTAGFRDGFNIGDDPSIDVGLIVGSTVS
jgi:hypothetical protein